MILIFKINISDLFTALQVTSLLRMAVGCVRSVDAESLKYCDRSWAKAPSGTVSQFIKATQRYLLQTPHPFLVQNCPSGLIVGLTLINNIALYCPDSSANFPSSKAQPGRRWYSQNQSQPSNQIAPN